MISILRDEHTPDLTAQGLMRRHLRGGMIVDVPIADPEEHPDALAWAAERERRDRAYVSTSSTGTGVAVRCVCWHRTAGDHTADCPAADTGDLLPPWREATETHREYRGTDANGRRVFAEVRTKVLRPPAESASVAAAPTASAESAPTDSNSGSNPAMSRELVAVVDTETTGLRPEGRICEIAFAVVDVATGEIIKSAAQLIETGVLMPPAATAVHGITDAMLAGKPKLPDVWPKVVAFVARHCPGLDVVAHNAPFDRGVLSDDLARHGLLSCDWPRWRWRDSITLARRIVPGLTTYSLHDSAKGPGLARALKLAKGTSHRALGDVLTTCALMAELRKRAAKPWGEWCGDAHVWGVGIERTERTEKTRASPKKAAASVPPIASASPATASLFDIAPRAISGDRR